MGAREGGSEGGREGGRERGRVGRPSSYLYMHSSRASRSPFFTDQSSLSPIIHDSLPKSARVIVYGVNRE